MNPSIIHPWNLSENEALALQSIFSIKVIKEDLLSNIKYVGGVDVAYDEQSDKLFASVVIIEVSSLEVIETAIAEDTVQFPYIPGLFSFRELPPIAKALQRLKSSPDLIICDGHGLAHPRRFGLACHLGVLFDVPTIGCGKTRLLGELGEIGPKRGDYAPLIDNNEVIGNVLRIQDNIKPVYVSIGHRISLQTACKWVLKLAPDFRLPETTRQADQAVRKALAKYNSHPT